MKEMPFQKVIAENAEAVERLLVAVILLLFILSPFPVFAEDPDCTGVDRWPTSMALVKLKNAGLTDNNKLDFTKTKTIRLASEKTGQELYRQVHYIVFTEKSGNTIEVITVNEASDEECSMGDVDVFVISRHLGSDKRFRKFLFR